MTPNPDHLDRLMDVLLEDEFGAREPTDLVPRVMARAFPAQQALVVRAPHRRPAFWSWIVGAASAVALAVGILSAWSARYPAPLAEGDFALEGSGTLQRGAVLKTGRGHATLKLGGYCSVVVSPESRVAVEGQPRSERVALLQGEVNCSVDKGVGAFDVRTPAGTVSVLGTEFRVAVQPKVAQASQALDYTLTVTVSSGRVNVNHAGKDVLLEPGPARVFGQAEPAATVNSEDPPQQRLPIEIDGERNALARGVVEGIVKAKTEISLNVTSVSGKTETYIPEWEGRQNGGPNRHVVGQIARLRIGARVRIHWYVDNKVRIRSLEVLENKEVKPPENF